MMALCKQKEVQGQKKGMMVPCIEKKRKVQARKMEKNAFKWLSFGPFKTTIFLSKKKK